MHAGYQLNGGHRAGKIEAPPAAPVFKPLAVPYAEKFMAYGTKYGVSPYLLAAQAKHESMQFDPDVISCRKASPAGAQGIAQFMPDTAKATHVNPCNVDSALDGQARYMAAKLKEWHGDVRLALAAYNAGSGTVRRFHGVPPCWFARCETQNYIPIILRYQGELQGTP